MNPLLKPVELFCKTESSTPSENIRNALVTCNNEAANEFIFEDIMASIQEYDFDNDAMIEKQEHFKLLNKSMKISEIGSTIRVPINNVFSQEPTTNFWVVASSSKINGKIDESRLLINYEEETKDTQPSKETEDFMLTFMVS